MRPFFKKRIIELLFELNETFTSANFLRSALSVRYKARRNYYIPTVMQISSFLVELEKSNILTKKNSDTKPKYLVLYQLKEEYHKPEDVELELGI